MNSTPHRIVFLTLALTGWAVAAAPTKAPINKYTNLWTNSPFHLQAAASRSHRNCESA